MSAKKNLYYYFIFFFFFLFFSCKNPHLDKNKTRAQDSIRLYNVLINNHQKKFGNAVYFKKLVDSLEPIYKLKKMDYHLIKLYYGDYIYAYNSLDTLRAKNSLEKIRKIGKANKDSVIQINYYFMEGLNDFHNGKRKQSFQNFSKATTFLNKKDSVTYYNCFERMTNFSIEVSDYDTAVAYLKMIRSKYKHRKNIALGFTYTNFARLYYKLKDKNMMKKYIDSAEDLSKIKNFPRVVFINLAKGQLELLNKNYNKAIFYFNRENYLSKINKDELTYNVNIHKILAFEQLGKKDSIIQMFKNIKPIENLLLKDRDIAKDYHPLKVKYTKGKEQKKAMIEYNDFLKETLEDNKGLLTAKFRFELEQKEKENSYLHKIESQKKSNLIVLFSSIIIVLSTLLTLTYQIQRKRKLENKLLNIKFETINKERDRISRELHDDLGATFTSITMATQMVKEYPEKSNKYLEVIFNSSNQMSEKINEVIWSLNTRNDNLESLIAYITSFAKRFLEPTEIDLRIHIENSVGTNKEKFIPANKRRIIYLICKEILNNIVKHADAKNTIIELILEDIKTFKIKIKDDGKGIKLNENQTGNGLKNIAENLTHINGSYDYITSDNGTEFLISVKI